MEKFRYPLEIKSVKAAEDGYHYVEGYASTWDKDRDGDIILPTAFDKSMDEFMKNPVILIDHDYRMENVIGNVVEYRIDEAGLWVKAKLIKPITDRAKQVIGNIIEGFSKTFSIGGMFERVNSVITSINLYEISAVTVPANSGAMFSMAKMLGALKEEKKEEVHEMERAEVESLIKAAFEKAEKEAEEAAEVVEEPKEEVAEEPKEEAVEEVAEEVSEDETKKEEEAKIAKMVEEKVAELTRKESKIEFPVSEKAGNLSVEDKQLADLLLGKKQTVTVVEGKSVPFMFKGGKILSGKGVAMDTAESGGGADWIPRELANALIDRVRLEAKAYSVFQEWNMPTQVYDVPIFTTDPTFYLQGEATDDSTAKATASNAGTSKMTLTAKKLGAKVAYSTELDEDSIVAMLPTLRNVIAKAAAETLDDCIINGDTAATQDSDSVAGMAITAWDGLRKLTLAESTVKSDLSTFSAPNLVALVAKLGGYAANMQDLVWICSTKTMWNKLMLLGRSDYTEKVFELNSSAYGGFGYLLGIPVVISAKVRDNVNASGVYDGTTTTKSTLLLVNKTRFMTGSKRQITFKTDFNGDRDQNELFITMRNAFSPVQAISSTVTSAGIGYNF